MGFFMGFFFLMLKTAAKSAQVHYRVRPEAAFKHTPESSGHGRSRPLWLRHRDEIPLWCGKGHEDSRAWLHGQLCLAVVGGKCPFRTNIINQSMDQSIDQSTKNQSVNQSINQSIKLKTIHSFFPPFDLKRKLYFRILIFVYISQLLSSFFFIKFTMIFIMIFIIRFLFGLVWIFWVFTCFFVLSLGYENGPAERTGRQRDPSGMVYVEKLWDILITSIKSLLWNSVVSRNDIIRGFGTFRNVFLEILYCPAVFGHFGPAPVKTDRAVPINQSSQN